MYSDFAGEKIDNSSNVSGTLNFYSTHKPNYGNYCIEFSNLAQYNAIRFNFKPNKNLSLLVENDYALDLFVRSSDKAASIDIRFVDSKTNDPNDKPWRSRYTIDNKTVKWSGEWEHLHIPLNNFKEQGAWDNAWYNPEGKFDWGAIDVFEIVTENKAMGTTPIWIDNIVITNLDTATVTSYNSVKYLQNEEYNFAEIRYSPSNRVIQIENNTNKQLTYRITDINGRIKQHKKINENESIDANTFSPGIYFVSVIEPNNRVINKRIMIF